MRYLVDENMPGPAVRMLRESGLDVEAAEQVLKVLASRQDWPGHFSVVSATGIRSIIQLKGYVLPRAPIQERDLSHGPECRKD